MIVQHPKIVTDAQITYIARTVKHATVSEKESTIIYQNNATMDTEM